MEDSRLWHLLRKPGRTVAKYVPPPEQIAASCAELDAKRLAAFDDGIKPTEGFHRKRKARKAANWLLQQSDESEPLDIDETDEQAWERFDALALDADERGVLSYYNIKRGHDAPYHDRANDEQVEMSKADVCNVEFLQFGDLDAILGDLIDVREAQHEMEDLSCRWNLGPVDPESFDVGEQEPFKSRDVVAFRSKRR